MDWIFDNFQILLIVGLAFASWLKSRQEAKQAEREAREAGEMPSEEEVFGPEEWWPTESAQPPPLPVPSYNAPAPPMFEEANALRERYALPLFLAGLFIAAFVATPGLIVLTPLFGVAFMSRVYKKLARDRAIV